MAEPQQIATASVISLIVGVVIVFLSLLISVPHVGNISIVLVAGLMIMIASALMFLKQALPFEVHFSSDDSSFSIKGPYYGRTIGYSEVSSVECRKLPLGTPLIAINAKEGVVGGQFRSPEVGMCHAVGHNRGEDTCYIVMKLNDGKTVAFNLETEEETEEVHRAICSRVSCR